MASYGKQAGTGDRRSGVYRLESGELPLGGQQRDRAGRLLLRHRGERPVLWGDGTQTRDYVHVSDVVRAIERIADARLAGVYNVGTGRNFSFNETVELLNGALGTDIEPVHEPVPLSNYNYRQRADPSRLKNATDWEPQIRFDEGIRDVCAPYV